MTARVLTWNLFHGRDRPPERGLFTLRSRLLRRSEAGRAYEQVNRPLLDEFIEVLERDRWDIALLQEAPPRWQRALASRLGAAGAIALTSRNWGGAVRSALADCNPDLVGFLEGGSNQLLARAPWRITAVRRATLRLLPERRRLLFAHVSAPDAELAVANLHAGYRSRVAAEQELRRAADLALAWAEGRPLVLGGDFNLRTSTSAGLFEELADRHGLGGATAAPAIDHLLVRGADASRPQVLAPDWRELPARGDLKLRLSDHPAVAREVRLLRRPRAR